MRARLLTGAILGIGTLAASLLLGPAAYAASNQDDWVPCADPYCYNPTDTEVGFKVIATSPTSVKIGWNPGVFKFENSGAPTSCTIDTWDGESDAHPLGNPFYPAPGQPKNLYIPSHVITIQAPGGSYRTDAIDVTPGEASYFQITCANTFTVVENGETLSLDATTDWMLRGSRVNTPDVLPLAPQLAATQKVGTQGFRIAANLHLAGKAKIDKVEYRVLRNGSTYRTDPTSFTANPATDGTYISYAIGDLNDGTYTVVVRAHNALGWGPYSNASTPVVITGHAVPTPPGKLPSANEIVKSSPKITSVKRHGSKSTITWHSGSVSKTKVVIKLGKKTVLSKTVGPKTRSVSLEAKHGKRYSIKFTAYLKAGGVQVINNYVKTL